MSTLISLAEAGFLEGHKEGYIAGRREGQIIGVRCMLLLQMKERFGPLANATCKRVKSADSLELDRWIDGLLTAKSLDELLA